MAFCPLCGKQLPPNGVCTCRAGSGAPAQDVTVQIQNPPQQPRPMQPQQAQPQQQPPMQPQQGQPYPQQGYPQQQQRPVQLQKGQSYPQQQPPMQPQQGQPYPQQGYPQQRPMQPQQGQPYPQQPYPQQGYPQQPYGQPYPQAPAGPTGPNPFMEAVNAFGRCFTKPGEAYKGALEGKVPVASGIILGVVYFLCMWLSTMLILLGKGCNGLGLKFLPAFGYGALVAVVHGGLRFGIAAMIKGMSGNKKYSFMQIYTAMSINTVLPGCVLFVMSLFQFASFYFIPFFIVLYVALAFYFNTDLLATVSENLTGNKKFWFNVAILSTYALVICLMYIIYGNIPSDAFDVSSYWSW